MPDLQAKMLDIALWMLADSGCPHIGCPEPDNRDADRCYNCWRHSLLNQATKQIAREPRERTCPT